MKKLLYLGLIAGILLCSSGFNALHSKSGHTSAIFVLCPAAFTVNSLGDEPDANPGDNVCATAGGNCTLRAAIQEANALGSCASIIDVNFSVTGTIELGSVLPTLSQSLKLNGPGANQLTVRRNTGGLYRVFTVIAPGKTFLFKGLTITGGLLNGTGIGSGIYLEGIGATITFENCVISNNIAANFGGGMRIASGVTAIISGSTFSGNRSTAAISGSQGTGGAIDNSGTLIITNSTFSGNVVDAGNSNGGAIWSNGPLTLLNCTLTNNSAAGASSAGGIYKGGDAVSLSNTIVAGNINAGAPDLRSNSGTFTTSGYNLIGDNSTVTATFPAGIPNGNNDYAGTNATPLNAALLVLGGNGGPTPTHALLACSPAVNAGTNVGVPATDQRGLVRPYNSGTSDIGAFELQDNAVANITYYQDADGDGFGNPAITQTTCAQPTGYVTNNTDCNDNNAAIKPDATELCDGIDNNCNGSADEGVTTRYYYDLDGDGYGEAYAFIDACAPSDLYTATLTGDCNAADADVYPGATEICDGIDNNCDGATDEGLFTRYFYDLDGDGYGETYAFIDACAPSGLYTATVDGDCNADDADVNPGATEICDGKDNNCDGVTDEGFITRYFYDIDGDGYGQILVFVDACAPSGFYTALLGGDCNDSDTNVNPGAMEVCNDIDENCDGIPDDGFPINRYYYDGDADGFGETNAFRDLCGPIGLYSATVGGDCNGGDNTVYPDAPELCDGKDNNCDGQTDNGILTTYYADSDGDGFGNPSNTTLTCSLPNGYVTNDTDCDDSINAINPAATETCDGIDNNCNGSADEGLTTRYYYDLDGDGYGEAYAFIDACAPSGFYTATVDGDCIADDAGIYPGAAEICDGKDNNCDGATDEGLVTRYFYDIDGDGYGQILVFVDACAPSGFYTALLGGDCNDSDTNVNPGAMEVCNDIDENCDGIPDEGVQTTYYRDQDGDGFGNPSNTTLACSLPSGYVTNNTDCNDVSALEKPDQVWFKDTDGDGHSNGATLTQCLRPVGYKVPAELTATTGDCNDNNAAIKPGALEICDGVDNDCDGVTDEGVKTEYFADADGDGFGDPNNMITECSQLPGYVTNNDDCNDADEAVNPEEEEVCDDKDNDCNGTVDDIGGSTAGSWTSGDVGGANGSANFPPCNAVPADVFTLTATGFSTSSSDKLQAVYQTLCGNGEIIARVLNVQNGGWAGIMLRETLNPGSKKVSLKTQLTPSIRREIRSTTNGAASILNFNRPQHVWFRLTRSGSNFVGYTSTDGATWSFAFAANISMNGCIYAGIFSESINANVTTTATFNNVSIIGATQNLGIAGTQTTASSDGQMPELGAEVYPNPTEGRVTVSFTNIPESRVTIRVFNTLGEQVRMQQTDALEKTSTQLDLADLADGVYTLRIETQGQAATKRIVIAKATGIRP